MLSRLFKMHKPAFTLIEVVIAVIVLGIAVPPTLNLIDAAAAGRADAINTTRATFLATTVIETVLADIDSETQTLGFTALADSAAYLDTPITGLLDRLSPIVDPYTSAGFRYTVNISELVDTNANVSIDVDENIFRVITVTVEYPSATSVSHQLPVSIMVSDL